MESRQRKWQKKRVKAGLCKICGKPREHYAEVCDEHAVKKRKQLADHRRREGKQKVPGRGGKPFVSEEQLKTREENK